jgi:hypothetical protein
MSGLAAIVALALAPPVAAQDNISGLAVDEGAAGTINIAMTSSTNRKSSRFQCTDPFLTSTTISVSVADCCIAGDIYRATVYKGTKGTKFNHTANLVSFAAAGSAPLGPDVFSALLGIVTPVKKVDVLATAGNSHPGGLPAGWTLRVVTNGGGPVCNLKQNIN